ncbi:MAG TPA: lipid II flippase MurJ, partial [Candidatus Acidoferrum sp.]|nr:lipid II flippase MurJ [Candidatus Acidoferrum sp.]
GLIVFRLQILHVLFERGAFTRPVTLLTAEILVGFAVGLTFYVGNRILAPAFYAMHDTRTPVLTGMAAVAVNIVTSLLLMRPLGVTGLALATAAASGCNFLLLFACLRRRIGLLGGRRMLGAVARVALACLPMAAWGILAQRWWDILGMPHQLQATAVLCGELLVAAGVFVASAVAVGCEEPGWALGLLGRGRERVQGPTGF